MNLDIRTTADAGGRHTPRRILAFVGAAFLVAGLIWNASALASGARITPAFDRLTQESAAPPQASLDRNRLAALERLARGAAGTLELPAAASLSAAHVVDRLSFGEYDEVVGLDRLERRLWLVRFESDDQMRTAVSFGVREARRTLGRAAIAGLADRLARALGVPAAPAAIAQDDASREWRIRWQRSLHGVAVRGDGAWLSLWADGGFHLFGRLARPTAPVPAETISDERAAAITDRYLDSWFPGAARADVSVAAMTLEWVAPNAMFQPGHALEPDPVLRLAWIARVTVSGPTMQKLGSLELYLDAQGGALLGGDVSG